MRSNAAGDMRSEMHEIIDMAVGDNTRQTFGVFDVGIFMERLAWETLSA
jgi:hypothetical protein